MSLIIKMPLTATLAQKLSKRGLVSTEDLNLNYKGYESCPNKCNIYHNCNEWCVRHWKGYSDVDSRYAARVHKLLKRYPLTTNWCKVLDKGLGRYYYWNLRDNLVSWLPPSHPRCNITEPASLHRFYLNKSRIKMGKI